MRTIITATSEAAPQTLASLSPGVAAYEVKNAAASTANLCVQVPGIHEEGRYHTLEPGDRAVFRLGNNRLTSVLAWRDGDGNLQATALHSEVVVNPEG